MDYFNELLDSYNRLKKRTFKLRYIQEETAEELQSRGFDFNPGSIGKGGKYKGFFYSSDGSIIYVSKDPPGTENKQYFQLPEKERGETTREKSRSKRRRDCREQCPYDGGRCRRASQG